ncbi:MAG: DNA polymerase II large subunit, partial [Candidatus Hydrothermarchaeales archaeon]
MKPEMERYFEGMEEEVKRAYDIAEEARKKGRDPELSTEIPLANDLAGRVEGLVGPTGIAERIRQLSNEFDKEEVALGIAKEIVEGGYGSADDIEVTCEQALRTSLALLTEGILAAPVEGIVKVRVKRNSDGSNYLAIYFAGPIRSAGGSAQALAVLTADYIRRILKLDRYKPTDEEVERFAEEVELYNAEASRLQYVPSPQEVREAIRHIPVEITGESTDKVEVSGYRDLERIETNRVRGGAMLVLAEGVLQKKLKIRKYVEKLKLEGWEWMLGVEEVQQGGEEKKVELGPNYKFIKDIIAGRPVLSHPSAKGGFRLRYGRSRTSGFAATCMHPATLVMLDDFIAIGTQIKTERPGKASAIGTCDSIEGPIVKLVDGSVLRVESAEEAVAIHGELKEILFLGDILVNYGDFLENNHVLMPSGHVEEWWEQELLRAGGSLPETLDEDIAIAISREYKVPLHPRYTYNYGDVEKDDIKALADWLSTGSVSEDALRLKGSDEKRTLELLGVPH